MADAICRVATGGGISKRALYTDADECIIHVCRPVLLNGIPALLARGDLADRAIAITLNAIPNASRRPETEVRGEFDRLRPGVLAALLDGMVQAMRDLPTLRLATLPRMADFARLACAAAPAWGWTADDMLVALRSNRESSTVAVVEGDPVANAVRDIATEGRWQGTATELLATLAQRLPVEATRDRGWPRQAHQLSSRLRRAAPALRRVGVVVDLDRREHGGRRVITITRANGEVAFGASPPSPVIETTSIINRIAGDAASDPSVTGSVTQRHLSQAGDAAASPQRHRATPGKSWTGDGGDAGDAHSPTVPTRDVSADRGGWL